MIDDYKINGDLGTPEMTFSIYGKEVSFAWDGEKQEWVSKELLELEETVHQACQFWFMIGGIFGIALGVLLSWMVRG